MNEIEGTAFALHVGIASGLRQFGHLLRSHEAVDALTRAARNDVDAARVVLGRLVRLSRLRIDPRYENPNDAALAVYLVVLNATSPELYAAAVDEVLTSTNLWWAAQIARGAIEESRQVSAAETLVIGEVSDHVLAPDNSVEATFPSGIGDEVFRCLWRGLLDPSDSGNPEESSGVMTESDSQYVLAA